MESNVERRNSGTWWRVWWQDLPREKPLTLIADSQNYSVPISWRRCYLTKGNKRSRASSTFVKFITFIKKKMPTTNLIRPPTHVKDNWRGLKISEVWIIRQHGSLHQSWVLWCFEQHCVIGSSFAWTQLSHRNVAIFWRFQCKHKCSTFKARQLNSICHFWIVSCCMNDIVGVKKIYKNKQSKKIWTKKNSHFLEFH